MLKVVDLTFRYDSVMVFEGLSFSASIGEIVLLSGENGSGKTTLLKCIAGIINAGKNVFIDGVEVKTNKNMIRRISYMMSEDTLYDYLTVAENIRLYSEMFRERDCFVERVYCLLEEFGLLQFSDYLVKSLSKGTRQKVYLLIMLSRNTDIFLLDEPFLSLDVKTQNKIRKIMRDLSEKEKLIIYSTHVAEFSQFATREYQLQRIEN